MSLLNMMPLIASISACAVSLTVLLSPNVSVRVTSAFVSLSTAIVASRSSGVSLPSVC